MKKLLLIALTLASVQIAAAQGTIHYYGWDTIHSHQPFDLLQTQDGGYMLIGEANWSAPLIENFYAKRYLVKTNSVGDTLWTRYYKQTFYGEPIINQDPSTGNITALGSFAGSYGCGLTFSSYPFVYYAVQQYSSSGDSLFTTTYHDTCENSLTDVAKRADGSLTGFVSSGNPIVVGFDYLYSIKEVSPSGAITHIPTSVSASAIEYADNGYWFAGYTSLSKVSFTGDIMWQNTISSPANIVDFCRVNGDSLLFAYSFSSYDTAYVVKTDSFGVQQWEKKYPFKVRDVMLHSTGKYILTGEKAGNLVVYVLDSNGDSLYTRTYQLAQSARGVKTIETTNELITLAASSGWGTMGQYVLVFDTLASTLTNVETIRGNASELNILPNPNSGTFKVITSGPAYIEIYNLLGEQVYGGEHQEQSKELSIDQTSGIYLIRATNASGTRTRKIVIR